MFARVIENWLTRASERSIQLPFCHMLAGQGHTIIHSTRHCGMELGKDVITQDREGRYCAFQLKSGDISLAAWRAGISAQVDDLVLGQIDHPSVPAGSTHDSCLVTTGIIQEEAQRAIEDRNRAARGRGQPELRTIVRGQLLRMAEELGTDLWPSELADADYLLRFAVMDGRDPLPRDGFCALMESLILVSLEKSQRPSGNALGRIASSSGLLCSLALSRFSEQSNHLAQTRGWTIYLGYLLAAVERWDFPLKAVQAEVALSLRAIIISLRNLVDELINRESLVEGDPWVDAPFYGIRMTSLLGAVSLLGIWRRMARVAPDAMDKWIHQFVLKHIREANLWSEAAIPQFLAIYYLMRLHDFSSRTDALIRQLVDIVCSRNRPRSMDPLAFPQYRAEDVLPYVIDSEISTFLPPQYRLTAKPRIFSLAGNSFSLEPLLSILVRRNYRQTIRLLWSRISRISFNSFCCSEPWQYYILKNSTGATVTRQPQHTQSWSVLRETYRNTDGAELPSIVKSMPMFLLLLLMVFPHRLSTDAVKWLDQELTAHCFGIKGPRDSYSADCQPHDMLFPPDKK